MKKKLLKIFYVLVRTLSVFGLPLLSKFRNKVYSSYFSANKISVSDRALITTAHLNSGAYIKIGDSFEMGRDAYIDYSGGVSIGDNVAISEAAMIFTHNHHVKDGYSNWHKNPIIFSEIEICDHAWVGASAIVVPGVRRIGKGAIIAAGAILTRDAEDYGVYAGNPAKKIYERVISEE